MKFFVRIFLVLAPCLLLAGGMQGFIFEKQTSNFFKNTARNLSISDLEKEIKELKKKFQVDDIYRHLRFQLLANSLDSDLESKENFFKKKIEGEKTISDFDKFQNEFTIMFIQPKKNAEYLANLKSIELPNIAKKFYTKKENEKNLLSAQGAEGSQEHDVKTFNDILLLWQCILDTKGKNNWEDWSKVPDYVKDAIIEVLAKVNFGELVSKVRAEILKITDEQMKLRWKQDIYEKILKEKKEEEKQQAPLNNFAESLHRLAKP